jgi:hypothetical protein
MLELLCITDHQLLILPRHVMRMVAEVSFYRLGSMESWINTTFVLYLFQVIHITARRSLHLSITVVKTCDDTHFLSIILCILFEALPSFNVGLYLTNY